RRRRKGHRQALRLRGWTGQGVRRRDGRAGHARSDAGAWRLRILDGVRGAALLARRARAVDLRGHQRDSVRGHRPAYHGAELTRGAHRAMSITNDGSYFEDFTVGDTLIHQRGRTITEADNHIFTSLVMNTAELHFN